MKHHWWKLQSCRLEKKKITIGCLHPRQVTSAVCVAVFPLCCSCVYIPSTRYGRGIFVDHFHHVKKLNTHLVHNVLCELVSTTQWMFYILSRMLDFTFDSVYSMVFISSAAWQTSLWDNKIEVEDDTLVGQWCSGRLGIGKIISPWLFSYCNGGRAALLMATAQI